VSARPSRKVRLEKIKALGSVSLCVRGVQTVKWNEHLLC
jgi:hypothetical protein